LTAPENRRKQEPGGATCAAPLCPTLINGNAALSAEMALRIEKAFGVKMETLLNVQAWYDAYTMRQRAGEIAVKPHRPPTPEI
jgi:plasmid maintenance system antidote protein VapI